MAFRFEDYVTYEEFSDIEKERDEFAEEIRHLSVRMSDVLTERDRYRELLHKTLNNGRWENDAWTVDDDVLDEIEMALEGEK